MRAQFKIIAKTQDYLLISDLYTDDNPTMTITNDAEAVVTFCWENGLIDSSMQLFYEDTEGSVDELVFNKNGEFTGFLAGYDSVANFLEDKNN